MYRWNRFLLTRTPAIVQAATLTEMFTPRVPVDPAAPDELQAGYGWGIAYPTTDVTYTHNGGIPGFKSSNLIRPRDQLSITVLCNTDNVDAGSIAWNLATIASR